MKLIDREIAALLSKHAEQHINTKNFHETVASALGEETAPKLLPHCLIHCLISNANRLVCVVSSRTTVQAS
jgi:hypothetical protein